MTPKQVRRAVTAFNAKYTVGSAFIYRSYPGAPEKDVTTRSEAYDLTAHTAVVMVNGVVGCVALDSLRPVSAPAGHRDTNEETE